jgi:hypothetical protein
MGCDLRRLRLRVVLLAHSGRKATLAYALTTELDPFAHFQTSAAPRQGENFYIKARYREHWAGCGVVGKGTGTVVYTTPPWLCLGRNRYKSPLGVLMGVAAS